MQKWEVGMKDLIEKLYRNNYLEKKEIIYLLDHINEEEQQILFNRANETRLKYYGNYVYMRAIIEFSNICKQDCMYCGIRKSNKKAKRYRLSKEQILECCEEGYKLGYRTFVLQGGEDDWYTQEKLAEIIKEIKDRYEDVALTLSIGEKSYEEYEILHKCGADRFLLRHETATKELYEQLHPNMSFENRRQCLSDLKEIGYQVGAGFLVGLPNQGNEDFANDLLFLKDIQPDMIGIGPFLPHHQTPLKDEKGGDLDKALIMIALTRLMVPECLLPATTAMGTISKQGREIALKAGANVVMPNLSPTTVRSKYELYDNKMYTGDEAAECLKDIERKINSAGFQVDMGIGDSYLRKKFCSI